MRFVRSGSCGTDIEGLLCGRMLGPEPKTVDGKVMKYVVVSGGVISGIGKGLTASSVGVLLKSCGFRVTAIKIDPYINIDAGTMSPFEHGEVRSTPCWSASFVSPFCLTYPCRLCPVFLPPKVFVLEDGGEADLDLGNYERFLDITLPRSSNITTGKVYQQVNTEHHLGRSQCAWLSSSYSEALSVLFLVCPLLFPYSGN